MCRHIYLIPSGSCLNLTGEANSLSTQTASVSDTMLDYDSMYEEEDEELGSLEGHGSVIQHLISQASLDVQAARAAGPQLYPFLK